MSEWERMDERPDCGRDAAAYVLGALEPHEVEPFRRHLRGCVVCRDEVAALGEVVAALPMAAPQLAVDPALRQRVMADVRTARRAIAQESAATSRTPLRASPWRAAVLAAAAAVAGLAIAAGVGAFSSGTQVRVVRATVTLPSASALVRVQGGRGELIIRRMPAAPAGKIYEVWLKGPGAQPAPTSALFDVTSAGSAAVDVPGHLRGVREILVTPEPRGGSVRPTHAPVIIARLA